MRDEKFIFEDMEKEREIGKTIKRIVENRGMRKMDAAKMVGVSKQAFWYVCECKEDRSWKDYELKHYCEKLRIDPGMLMCYLNK